MNYLYWAESGEFRASGRHSLSELMDLSNPTGRLVDRFHVFHLKH
jgi:hypothetical protein